MKKTAILLFLFSALFIFAAEFEVDSYLQKQSQQLFPEAVKLRRQLHRIPELCFQEVETSRFIKNYLEKNGFQVIDGLAGTGMKAVLRGNREGPVVGIRTDMDALPIQEKTGLPFSSQNPGRMHACGHDGHMTNVLIAARMLAGMRDELPGTVVFIFQPCEEGTSDGSPAGASRIVKAGVLENPKIDAMFGLHIMPGYKAGAVALREGAIMANVASVFITIEGKSSHGAYPHQGIDAIYAASSAIQQFQSLISRYRDPKEQAVLTIGTINGGVRFNVIADRVEMKGTVRTFSFETQEMIKAGMEKILKGLALSQGIAFQYKFSIGSKFVKNDSGLTQMALPLFKKILGPANVFITPAQTVGEDFSTYSHLIPSLFFFLGAGEEGVLHSADFSIDEDMFLYGPRLLASAAFEYMKRNQK